METGLDGTANNISHGIGTLALEDSFLVTRTLSLSPLSPSQGDWQCLCHGVDRLHVGLYVEWGQHWRGLDNLLAAIKVQANNTNGIHATLGTVPCIAYAKGLGRTYRYHVKVPDVGDMFVAATPAPTTYPNVMCWVDCHTLWKHGPVGVAGMVEQLITRLGGIVRTVTPSRIDYCADFHVPHGITLDHLQRHRVGRKKVRPVMTGDRLETYTVGTEGAAITARLYDKVLQLNRHTGNAWTWDLWPQGYTARIWRVEFQLLRPALLSLGINSIDDVVNRAGGVWRYLTNKWLTFRSKDNANATRRTTEPGWKVVQDVAERFGPVLSVGRRIRGMSMPTRQKYLQLIAGCLPGYAARLGCRDLQTALAHLKRDMQAFYANADFAAKCDAKSAALGLPRPQQDAINAA